MSREKLQSTPFVITYIIQKRQKLTGIIYFLSALKRSLSISLTGLTGKSKYYFSLNKVTGLINLLNINDCNSFYTYRTCNLSAHA